MPASARQLSNQSCSLKTIIIHSEPGELEGARRCPAFGENNRALVARIHWHALRTDAKLQFAVAGRFSAIADGESPCFPKMPSEVDVAKRPVLQSDWRSSADLPEWANGGSEALAQAGYARLARRISGLQCKMATGRSVGQCCLAPDLKCSNAARELELSVA